MVGINDKKPDANFGSLDFTVAVRNPTPDDWRAGDGGLACQVLSAGSAAGTEKWATETRRRIEALFEGQGGAAVASAIQRIAHPSGKNPTLGKILAHVDKDKAVVRIPVSWMGALVGGHHETVVVWDFSNERHYTAIIESDSSPTLVAKKNAQDLDTFFRTKMFPKMLSR